jgi:hypothetical protein
MAHTSGSRGVAAAAVRGERDLQHGLAEAFGTPLQDGESAEYFATRLVIETEVGVFLGVSGEIVISKSRAILGELYWTGKLAALNVF